MPRGYKTKQGERNKARKKRNKALIAQYGEIVVTRNTSLKDALASWLRAPEAQRSEITIRLPHKRKYATGFRERDDKIGGGNFFGLEFVPDGKNQWNGLRIVTPEVEVVYGEGGRYSVVVKEGTTIGEKAFYVNRGLTSITFPEGLTTIGEMAFGWCTNLTSVVLPSTLTTIENEAFAR